MTGGLGAVAVQNQSGARRAGGHGAGRQAGPGEDLWHPSGGDAGGVFGCGLG